MTYVMDRTATKVPFRDFAPVMGGVKTDVQRFYAKLGRLQRELLAEIVMRCAIAGFQGQF